MVCYAERHRVRGRRKAVSAPERRATRDPGKPRKRVPIAGSEAWGRAQARREARKLSADYAAGKIVFDEKPGTVTTTSVLTVRQLGEQWTSGDLVKTYGNVNRLRVKAGAKIDAWCLKANAYEVRTRGPGDPLFGDLLIASVTTDDVCVPRRSPTVSVSALPSAR